MAVVPRNPVPPGVGFSDPRLGSASLRDAFSLHLAAGVRAGPRQRLAGSWIAQRIGADREVGLDASLTALLSLHYTVEVHPRWTVGASTRRFAQHETGTTSYGAGLEAGHLAWKDLWIVAGYNVKGFRDEAFPTRDRTDEGGVRRRPLQVRRAEPRRPEGPSTRPAMIRPAVAEFRVMRFRSIVAATGLSTVVLTACAPTETRVVRVVDAAGLPAHPWIGKTESLVLETWGPNPAREPDGAGGSILAYKGDSTAFRLESDWAASGLPSPVPTGSPDSNPPSPFGKETLVFGPTPSEPKTSARFWVDARGLVYRVWFAPSVYKKGKDAPGGAPDAER